MTLLLKIHVEGFTEASFASRILRPHFEEYDCSIAVIINKTSNSHGIAHRGGLSHYEQFRVNTRRLLKNKNAVVTTMIDYYGLPTDFPGMTDCWTFSTATDLLCCIERLTAEDSSCKRLSDEDFIPCILLHECDSLLFSYISVL